MFRFIIAFIMLAVGTNTYGQLMEAPEWNAEILEDTYIPGDTVTARFTAKIAENWYMYSSDFSKNLGPTVTEFHFEDKPEFKVVGEVNPVGAKRKYDELYEGEYTYFTHEAVFEQRIMKWICCEALIDLRRE